MRPYLTTHVPFFGSVSLRDTAETVTLRHRSNDQERRRVASAVRRHTLNE